MYTTLYEVDSLPQSGIDLNGVYELRYRDFFRIAGTKWSYSYVKGWFENDISPQPLTQFPIELIADKYLKVNSEGTGYELVDIAIPTITVIPIVLLSSNWIKNYNTITATGVTTINEIWWDAISLAEHIKAGNALLWLYSQDVDTLVFQCANVPTEDISLNITMLDT